jgi:hypothetical protein
MIAIRVKDIKLQMFRHNTSWPKGQKSNLEEFVAKVSCYSSIELLQKSSTEVKKLLTYYNNIFPVLLPLLPKYFLWIRPYGLLQFRTAL